MKYLTFICVILLLISCRHDMSMKMNNPHNIHGVWSYKKVFSDLNDTQLKAAKANGIIPIEDREAAEKMKSNLEELTDCEEYEIDSLTHSIPYLVPSAAQLLKTIGQNFKDSLEQKGLNPYRILVTSVLRTKDDVKKLRRHNGNATQNSAHFYGTTFDISWKNFCQEEGEYGIPMEAVNTDTLKMVLSEVLRDLKNEEACYVKYELKQGCFHITTRK